MLSCHCLICLALQGFALKKIVKYASNKHFSDVIVFNEDRKKVNGMLLIHLPKGPTAQFKLSNLTLSKDIKVTLYQLESRHVQGIPSACQTATNTRPEN